jgi:hypothetical protein
MLVVPLEKDKVTTKDRKTYKVVSYTNFKEGGPAVYCRLNDSADNVLVYFFDIEEINGVRVEYVKGSKVFTALGKLVRPMNLPQPDDKITVIDRDDNRRTVTVDGLKLKQKQQSHNRGLLVKDTDGELHRLKDIVAIDRTIGSDRFSREAFKDIYAEYMGI